MDEKYFYIRNLPHWQPREETFFITYRLAGSIPKNIIEDLKVGYLSEKGKPENQTQEAKELIREAYFETFDEQLAKNLNEPHWLKKDEIAHVVMQSLLFRNNIHYILWCVCIMSNHVHLVLSTLPESPLLNVILQNHKKFTAVTCNKLLNRSGSFWTAESFDTIIRNEKHYYRCINYTLQNPVKAGLVKHWMDYKWTYLHPGLEDDFKMLPAH
jgi:putative transposase